MKLYLLKYFLVIAILGFSSTLFSQTIITDTSRILMDVSGEVNGAEIMLPAVKKLAEYPGGKKAWQNFLLSKLDIKAPLRNGAVPGAYTVMIRFSIGSDGRVFGIGADSNIGYGLEKEVIRCIKESMNWIPAQTGSGRIVGSTLRTMVTFIVKRDDVLISFQ